MSREQFLNLPPGPPYYDYIDGEAVEMNRPSPRHQIVAARLFNALYEYLQQSGKGVAVPDVNLELPSGFICAPDIMAFAPEQSHALEEEPVQTIPLLIVEVLSPSTESYDRNRKMREYHAAGVPWLWYIDQDTLEVEEYQHAPEGYVRLLGTTESGVFAPRLFPDWSLRLSECV